MPRVIHFEINADSPQRAIKFYQKVFGWKIKKWEGPMDYWLVMTGDKKQPGIDGGIMPRNTNENTTNTVDVPSVDEFCKKIEKADGRVLMPKSEITSVGYFARCQDTEGNMFGIIETKPMKKVKSPRKSTAKRKK